MKKILSVFIVLTLLVSSLPIVNIVEAEGVTTTSPANTVSSANLGIEDFWSFGRHDLDFNSEAAINIATGNLVLTVNELRPYLRGSLGFNLNRYYNSGNSLNLGLGKGWSFTGSDNLVEKVENGVVSEVSYTDEDLTSHTFKYNMSNSTFESPKGKYLKLTKISGLLYEIKDKTGIKKVFERISGTNRFRILSYTDLHQNKISIFYNSITSKVDKIAEVDSTNNIIGEPIIFTDSNQDGLIEKITFASKVVEFVYSNGYLTETKTYDTTKYNINDPNTYITNKFVYNLETSQLVEFYNAKNNMTKFTRSTGNLDVQDSQGRIIKYNFSNGNQFIETDSKGNQTIYDRDTINNTLSISKITYSNGNLNQFVRDENYNILTSTNEIGQQESFFYDANGNVISHSDIEGKETSTVFGEYSKVLNVTKPDGSTTTFSYDSTYKNLLSTTSPTGETTRYEYDSFGRIIKTTLPNGSFRTNSYSYNSTSKEWTVKETDVYNKSVTTIYNLLGNVVKKIDELGKVTAYSYDGIRNNLTGVTNPFGFTTAYKYDKNGKISEIKDARGKIKTFKYSSNDQLTAVQYPSTPSGALIEEFEYDQSGNQNKLLKYNLGTTKTLLASTINSYDSQGNITNVAVNDGQNLYKSWSYEYDSLNRKTKMSLGSLVKAYVYDPNNNELVQYSDRNMDTKYRYDILNRVTGIDASFSNSPTSTTPEFRSNFVQSYDDDNRVKEFSVFINGSTSPFMSGSYDYNTSINEEQVTIPNKIKKVKKINSNNNLESIAFTNLNNNTVIDSIIYKYNSINQIISRSSKEGEVSYQYNNNKQLTKEAYGFYNDYLYSYDGAGNRTLKSQTVSSDEVIDTFYVYNDANQITSKEVEVTDYNNNTQYVQSKDYFEYDKLGNLTKDEKFSYKYDVLGNLIEVKGKTGNLIATYEYDEEGIRTKKTVGNTTYKYYYEADKLSTQVEILNGITKSYTYFVYDNEGKPLTMLVMEKLNEQWSTKKYYYVTDGHGDVVKILDDSGATVASYSYYAFGGVRSSSGAMADYNPIRYAGYYYDKETSLYYLRARYYDPENANFLSLDPLMGTLDEPISLNGYNYANNNPVMNIDPTGMYWKNAWWNSRWFVSGALNAGIMAIAGGIWGGFANYARKKIAAYGRERARFVFSTELKRQLLRRQVSWGVATAASSAAYALFNVLTWKYDPGEHIFDYVDASGWDAIKKNKYWNLW